MINVAVKCYPRIFFQIFENTIEETGPSVDILKEQDSKASEQS